MRRPIGRRRRRGSSGATSASHMARCATGCSQPPAPYPGQRSADRSRRPPVSQHARLHRRMAGGAVGRRHWRVDSFRLSSTRNCACRQPLGCSVVIVSADLPRTSEPLRRSSRTRPSRWSPRLTPVRRAAATIPDGTRFPALITYITSADRRAAGRCAFARRDSRHSGHLCPRGSGIVGGGYLHRLDADGVVVRPGRTPRLSVSCRRVDRSSSKPPAPRFRRDRGRSSDRAVFRADDVPAAAAAAGSRVVRPLLAAAMRQRRRAAAPSVVEEWRSRTRHEILNGFGTTELAHIVISARAGAARPGSIGEVVAGYDARIVGEDLGELPCGVGGLLAVRGPTGARYWRDPMRKRHAFATDGR